MYNGFDEVFLTGNTEGFFLVVRLDPNDGDLLNVAMLKKIRRIAIKKRERKTRKG